jgi:hypothetical protein
MATARPIHSPISLMGSFPFLLDRLAEAARRQKIRRVYGGMSLALLHDIGLTSDDLLTALALPLDRDAGAELARLAAVEADRW